MSDSALARSPALRAALCALCALAAGCASLDLEAALQRLRLAPPASIPPPLRETPAAALLAVEGLRATSGELRAVPLSWDPLLIGDVAGYAVERADAREGPFERRAAVPGRAHTLFVDRGQRQPEATQGAEVPGLADGATFFYRVRAFDPAGHLAAAVSEAVEASTAPLPDPPQDLRAWSLQPGEVPLRWSAPGDARVAGYVVYRSPTSWGPFEPLAEIDARHDTVYVDHGLGDLRVFYYRVASRHAGGGEGPTSASVRAVTKPAPLPPFGLRVAGQQLGANRLFWERNVEKDVVEYQLFRTRAGAEAPELVVAVPAHQSEAEDDRVGADERLSYALVAIDRDGLRSDPGSPLAVVGTGYALRASAGPGGVALEWEARADEGFHGARVLRNGLFSQRELGSVEGGAFLDRAATRAGRYRYVVVLRRADGTLAPPSSPVEIRVPAH
jgi:hypothetical protein